MAVGPGSKAWVAAHREHHEQRLHRRERRRHAAAHRVLEHAERARERTVADVRADQRAVQRRRRQHPPHAHLLHRLAEAAVVGRVDAPHQQRLKVLGAEGVGATRGLMGAVADCW